MLGVDYYRLQLIDLNKNVTYSQVIGIQFANQSNSSLAGTVSVYPNPAHDQVNISINATGAASAFGLTITNSNGSVVKQINSVQPTSAYDVSAFIPGVYYLVMTDNNTNTVIAKSKFVKL